MVTTQSVGIFVQRVVVCMEKVHKDNKEQASDPGIWGWRQPCEMLPHLLP